MPTLLLLLIAGGIIYFFWNAARSAAERAVELGRNACRAADVQWLDQAVHATGLRLSRGEDGRLGFERTFKFEYSYDGIDRHVGRMVLRGDQLISFTGPGAARISQIRADVDDAEDISAVAPGHARRAPRHRCADQRSAPTPSRPHNLTAPGATPSNEKRRP